MNIPGERVIAMHGKNHRQVCQFDDERSSDYKVVSELIHEWTTGEIQEKSKLDEEDIGERLNVSQLPS
jgi:DNA-binding GntR family transcriptional regulator